MPAERKLPAAPGGALILAAGFSRRFGSDKRRHPLPDGRPLLVATIETYADVFDAVCVVLRDGDADLREQISVLPCRPRVVIARDAHLGMGHSLAAGVRAIAGGWSWICVALGDMPFVRPSTLEALATAFAEAFPNSMVQPLFDGRPGHPVFFPASRFAELQALTGDAGARRVLDANAGQVLRLVVDDPGVLQDLDRPPDA